MTRLPELSPPRKPPLKYNRYQAGLLKILGKIDPRIWTLLWHMCSDIDDRGVTTMGNLQLSYRTGWSELMVDMWLARAKDMGWFSHFIEYVPVEYKSIKYGKPLERRRQIFKLMAREIPAAKIVSRNKLYPGSCPEDKYTLYSLMRMRLYRPIWDQDLRNWHKRVYNRRKREGLRYRRKKALQRHRKRAII